MWVGDSFQDLAEIPGPVHLAIGVFDGLHLGHIAVIRKALDGSRTSGGTTALLTFHPHPMTVLRPDAAPDLLTGSRQKLDLLKALGVHHVVVLPFTRDLSAMTGAGFVLELTRYAKPLRHICVGHEWSFGHQRSGNIDLLKEMGAKHGFGVDAIAPVTVNGQTVSSTNIRKAVREGNLELARSLLGRPYGLFGTVIDGDKRGRQLGFPTANIRIENEVLPPDGVYRVRTVIEGVARDGVANLGVRPTVDGTGMRSFEVHVLDYDGDLYGSELTIDILEFLRGEMKFNSVEALSAQIRSDIDRARNLINSGSVPAL
jgi:riboflavin kinase/FMN adenylyltransferase